MLLDVKGFSDGKENESDSFVIKSHTSFKENSFSKGVMSDISPLVKMDVINHFFRLDSLLKNLGIEVGNGTMYCPFHDDEMGGKPSAKYHSDTDLLYCFSENKMYSAYHAVKFLYHQDVNRVFDKIWKTLPKSEKLKFLGNRDSDMGEIKVDSQWDFYMTKVLGSFKRREVTFPQYKRALYKILELSGKGE